MTPALVGLLAEVPAWDKILACPTFWGLALGVVGLWLLIPGGPRLKWVGGALTVVGLGCLFADLGWLGDYADQTLFLVLASVTLVAAVGTITSQSPVYCAVWFALSLLGTAGVFLLQGAQFLGVATIVVYAGAIVVTFLFVLMLAQPEGHSTYDRISWGPLPVTVGVLAAGTLIGVLTHSLAGVKHLENPPVPVPAMVATVSEPAEPLTASIEPAPLPKKATHSVLQRDHMAGLGRELFSKQLISVEIAGTLLLVALVGAVGMMIQGKLARQEQEA